MLVDLGPCHRRGNSDHADAQPVEDIGVEWDESRFPFEEIATVTFPRQDSLCVISLGRSDLAATTRCATTGTVRCHRESVLTLQTT